MFKTVSYSLIALCIMMGFGFFFSKRKILDDVMSSKISYILLNLSMPCMVITAMQIDFSVELLHDALICFGVFIGIQIFGAVCGILLGKVMEQGSDDKGITTFSLIFPNVMYIGFPVIKTALGATGFFYANMCSTVFNLACFSFGIKIIAGRGVKLKLSQMLSPACIASVVGFVFFIFGIRPWEPINTAISGIAATTVPLSMLIIGSMLANADAKTFFADIKLYIISALRLLILPVIIYFALRPFIADKTLLLTLTLLSGMPVATVCAIFAQNSGRNALYASKLVFLTTVLSIVTLPLLSVIAR